MRLERGRIDAIGGGMVARAFPVGGKNILLFLLKGNHQGNDSVATPNGSPHGQQVRVPNAHSCNTSQPKVMKMEPTNADGHNKTHEEIRKGRDERLGPKKEGTSRVRIMQV